MNDKLEIAVRPAGPQDYRLCQKSYIGGQFASLRFGCSREGKEATHFHDEMRVRFNAMWRHAQFMVACDVADPTVVFGWAATESGIVHYVYVKKPYRRQGVATALCANLPALYCTHWSQDAQAILSECEQLSIFNISLDVPELAKRELREITP